MRFRKKLARGESRQAFLRNRTPSTITSHLYIRQAVVFPLDASTQAPLFYAQLFSTRFSTNDFFKMTALSKGPIHGLMFNELQAPIAIKKFGMQSLIDLMESKIPSPQNCFIVKRNYLESNRGKVTNFMKAVIEAMYLLKIDRALALRLIKKYIRVSDDEAAIGYDYYLAKARGRHTRRPRP